MNKDLKTAEDVKKFLEANDLPENFCIIPFINMILGPGGDVSVCRQKGSKHIVGNLKENSLEEIWNGEYLQNWRQEFLDGNPKVCSHEVKYVHCHLSPEHYWDQEEVTKEKVQQYPFKKLTANLNGECNLKCVMCDVWKQENGFYNEENFWKGAKEDIFPYIKEVEMLSGEPLIQEDTFRMIDEMAEINPDAQWSITTNGIWNFEGRIKEALQKIKIKRFIFSIDSFIKERYSKIRINGDLEILESNVRKLTDFSNQSDRPFDVTVHFLVMTSNYDEILNAVKKSRELGAKLILDICEYPRNLSIFKLSEDERVKIVDALLEECPEKHINSIMATVLRISNSFSQKNKKEMLLKLLDKREVKA